MKRDHVSADEVESEELGSSDEAPQAPELLPWESLHEGIENLREKTRDLEHRWGNAWHELRFGVERAWVDLRASLKNARAKLHKEHHKEPSSREMRDELPLADGV